MTKINLTPILHMPMTSEKAQEGAVWLTALSHAYRKDPDFRSKLGSDPTVALTALGESGVEVAPDMEMCIVEDSDEVFHFVFTPDWNANMGDEALDMVAGGKSAAAAPAPTPRQPMTTQQSRARIREAFEKWGLEYYY